MVGLLSHLGMIAVGLALIAGPGVCPCLVAARPIASCHARAAAPAPLPRSHGCAGCAKTAQPAEDAAPAAPADSSQPCGQCQASGGQDRLASDNAPQIARLAIAGLAAVPDLAALPQPALVRGIWRERVPIPPLLVDLVHSSVQLTI